MRPGEPTPSPWQGAVSLCPAARFRGGSANKVETAEGDPTTEPYTLALLIRWTEIPGTENILRPGSSSTGDWLWMASSDKLWGRHAGVDSPASGSGPTITAGWHTLVRTWDGREGRQYLDGLRTDTTPVTATGGWTLHRWGWQFTSSQALEEACVPFFGAFGAAWDDVMVARWSASPLAMLWPETDATFVMSGGGPQAVAGRPVVIIAPG